MWRSKLFAWTTGLAAALAAAGAPADGRSGTSFSGSVRLDYFSTSQDLEGTDNVFGANLEFKLLQRFSRSQQIDFEGRLSRDDFTRDGHDHFRFLNAYYLLRSDYVDLRLGEQLVRWGKADGINPTDYFTPLDLTVLLPLESDQHLAVPVARADVPFGDSQTLSVVVEPAFTPGQLPFVAPIPINIDERRPSGLSQPQVGARFSSSGENLDWSACAFRGFSTMPLLNYTGLDANGVPNYARYYPGIEGLGADLAHNFGHLGFRAELAYTIPRDDEGKQGVAPSYFLVTGIDRSIDDWNVNLQALLHYTPGFTDPNAGFGPNAPQALSSNENALIYNETHRFLTGVTSRISANWLHQTLQTEVLFAGYFSPTNYLVRPLITYALSDKRRILVGGEYYAGPEVSYFGELHKNSTVFFEFQQYF